MLLKKVSVIIPVHGVEKYIAAAVQSALDQTYSNFELIIVDNASPDRSIEICQQFTDDRIRIIRQANRGPAGSRNTGIRHATGDYISFLDGDDLWMPEKLAQHVAHLDRHPHVGISFCYSELIDPDSQSVGLYMISKRLKDFSPQDMLCRCPLGNGSTNVYRREVFEAIQFQDNLYGTVETFYFDERLKSSEDAECWFRMAVQCDLASEGIPAVLTQYRIHNHSSSANLEQYVEHIDTVIETARRYAPDIIATHESALRAYQLRFAARRAIALQASEQAIRYSHQAIAAYRSILLEDGQRTLVTLAAAHLMALMPRPIYTLLQSQAIAIVGRIQRCRIKRIARRQKFTAVNIRAIPPKASSRFRSAPPIPHRNRARTARASSNIR
jgi:glycosyltransferase involved in cell wall biosynthesis